MRPVITLLTDFGDNDPCAGIMKGVILSDIPDAAIVDLTHQIPPQDARRAALVLAASYPYFPPGSVHVVVVDPGVGGTRRALAVQAADRFFVGPDNGVLTPALREKGSRAFELTQQEYFRASISASFHGRDVFAPVAAAVAKGVKLPQMGKRIADFEMFETPPALMRDDRRVSGEIIYIDHFGNAMTNLAAADIASGFDVTLPDDGRPRLVAVGNKTLGAITTHYAGLGDGETGAIINSWGHLEIFRRNGNAARQHGLRVGNPVTVFREERKNERYQDRLPE